MHYSTFGTLGSHSPRAISIWIAKFSACFKAPSLRQWMLIRRRGQIRVMCAEVGSSLNNLPVSQQFGQRDVSLGITSIATAEAAYSGSATRS